MADNKKNVPVTDDQKASSISQDASLVPVAESKRKVKIRKAPKVKKQKKKGLPIVLDILIVILLIGVIGAAVWGIWSLGKYFATQYEEVEISYTMLIEDVDKELALADDGFCVIEPDSHVYLAQEQEGYELGTVLSVSTSIDEQDGTVDVYVTVKTVAGYNIKLGYFIDQTKIAVGKVYTCRFSGLMGEAVIVELQRLVKE